MLSYFDFFESRVIQLELPKQCVEAEDILYYKQGTNGDKNLTLGSLTSILARDSEREGEREMGFSKFIRFR